MTLSIRSRRDNGAVLCTSGMLAEARVARAAGFSVIVGAGRAMRNALFVEQTAKRAKCLVSFGIAGGLAPFLRPGDVVLSTHVIGAERRWRAATEFRARFAGLAQQLGAREGPLLGSRDIVASREQKARLWHETGALAVDLESAVVAGAAEAAGIPFLVLRAIADPATRDVPSAASVPFAVDDGSVLVRFLVELAAQPGQIVPLLALAWETRRALSALAIPARALRAALAAADWEPSAGQRVAAP